jgi:hypothetical protein
MRTTQLPSRAHDDRRPGRRAASPPAAAVCSAARPGTLPVIVTAGRERRARQMLLLLLAAAALPLQAAAQLYIPTDLGCDAEDELLGNLRWLRSVCAEVGAAFADDATPVPTTIADLGCARAARRVATSCGGLLSSSPWFASRRAALDAAVASAANLPDDSASTYHIADPSLSAVHSCGATLDDGFAQFPTARNGQSYVTIDVGPSHGNLRLDVDHLSPVLGFGPKR